MNIIILGAAGFIGTNLSIRLAENSENKIVAVDKYMKFFSHMEKFHFANVRLVESSLDEDEDFSILVLADGIKRTAEFIKRELLH